MCSGTNNLKPVINNLNPGNNDLNPAWFVGGPGFSRIGRPSQKHLDNVAPVGRQAYSTIRMYRDLEELLASYQNWLSQ